MAKAYKTLRMRATDFKAAVRRRTSGTGSAIRKRAGAITGWSALGVLTIWANVWPDAEPVINKSIESRERIEMARIEAGRATSGLTAWQIVWPRNGTTNTVGGTLLRMERDIESLKLKRL